MTVNPCKRCGGTNKAKDGRCKDCRRKRESGERAPTLKIPAGIKLQQEAQNTTNSYRGATPCRILVDGDLHYPDHDPYVEAAKIKFAQDWKPEAWVGVGDTYDFYSISRYVKDPARLSTFLQHEFDSAQPYIRERHRLTAGEDVYLMGNHEYRLHALICANPGLSGLRALEFRNLAELPARATVLPYKKKYRIGPITFEHGDDIGGKMGCKNPASWYHANRGAKNVIFGHFHRFDIQDRTLWDEDGTPHMYTALAQGHGQDVSKATYMTEHPWQHGFTAIETWQDNSKTRFTMYPIRIINGCFSWGGKVYNGRKA